MIGVAPPVLRFALDAGARGEGRGETSDEEFAHFSLKERIKRYSELAGRRDKSKLRLS